MFKKSATKARQAGMYDGWHEASFFATYGRESGAVAGLADKCSEYAEVYAEGWVEGRPQCSGWDLGRPHLEILRASCLLTTDLVPEQS